MPTARSAEGFALRPLLVRAAIIALLPAFAVAETAGEEAPLTLNTEVMVPPQLTGSPQRDDTEAEPRIDASPIVEAPPVVEGSTFLDTPLINTDSLQLESVPEVPSVAVEPAEPIAPPPVTALEITLDWYLNPQHAALLVAREKGMFARRGLDVTLVSPADPNVPAKLLAAGRTDLAVGRQTLLHFLVDQGVPLVRVATLIDTPLAGLVLRQSETSGHSSAGASGASEGPGLRIGYTAKDDKTMLASSLVSANGLLAGLELDDVNFSALGAMREGSVDGVVINQRHLLARQLADEGIATQTLRIEEHGLPGHDGLILMANRDHLGGKRDAIQRLVAALEEASLWMVNHPQEAWQVLVAAEPALDDSSMHDAWKEILPRLALRPAAVDLGRYQRFEQLLFDAGLVETLTPVERLAVDLGAPPP